MTQTSFPDDQAKKKKNRILSIWDGVFASFNAGCGETHVSAFVILFRATNLQVGLLASLPNLIASLCQLKTPACVEKVRSRKKIIVVSVILQLMMWFPIIAIAFTGWERHSVSFLILFYSLYSTFGSFLAPAWGSLMSESVAENERGKYFGLRGKIGGVVTVLSGFGAGYLLYALRCPVYQRFALVFLMAAIARSISGVFLMKMYDPPLVTKKEHYFSFWDFLGRLPKSNFAQYVFCIGLFHFCAYMAGPYFAVLMLRDFGFSYLTYTFLITTASVASLLGLTHWGRHADTFGNVKLIKGSAALIVAFPLLWIFSHQVWYLFLVQLAAGYLWGGFNLCISNFIYDAAIPEKRVYCIAYSNVINGVFIFLGTITGGYLADHLPPFHGYRLFSVLLLSFLGRLLVVLFLLRRVKEVREVKPLTKRDLFLQITGLSPVLGSFEGVFPPAGRNKE